MGLKLVRKTGPSKNRKGFGLFLIIKKKRVVVDLRTAGASFAWPAVISGESAD